MPEPELYELSAEMRESRGTGASRRLRHGAAQPGAAAAAQAANNAAAGAERVPAILYGGGKPPAALSLVRKDLEHALENEGFYSHILSIKVGEARQQAILKDLQRHPARGRVLHADFMRVSDDVKVKVNVPLHFLNEAACYGVKTEGGLIQHSATEVEVLCLPGDIPEYLEVDMLEVKVGEIIHLSAIKLPPGVESVALSHGEAHDLAIASVLTPRGGAEEEEAEEGGEKEDPEAAEAAGDGKDKDGADKGKSTDKKAADKKGAEKKGDKKADKKGDKKGDKGS